MLVPGTTLVTPSLFVTPTLFCGVSVSLSVALLLAVFGSNWSLWLTEAVLVSTPVAEGSMAATTV